MFRISSFACGVLVICDSCKVNLGGKKKKCWRRGHWRQPDWKICRLWCLCVKWLIWLSICRHFRIIYFKKPAAFKSVKTGLSHSAHQSFSQQQNEPDIIYTPQKAGGHVFKDILDDCYNLERLLMMSSLLHFFFNEDAKERRRLLRCALQLQLGQLLIWRQLVNCCQASLSSF